MNGSVADNDFFKDHLSSPYKSQKSERQKLQTWKCNQRGLQDRVTQVHVVSQDSRLQGMKGGTRRLSLEASEHACGPLDIESRR